MRTGSRPGSAPSNWPLTGGVPSLSSTAKGAVVERVYFVGYSNGSVLVCDAKHVVLSYICYIEGEVSIPHLYCPHTKKRTISLLFYI